MANAAGHRRPAAPPLVVFVHIPKTAGSTVRTILDINEPGGLTRPIPNVFKGGGGLNKELIERLRNGRGPLDRKPRDLRTVRILRGHAPLGIREYLPRYLSKDRETRYFSFLREPVDRSISHYFQIRLLYDGSQEQGKYALSEIPEDPTLEDMLEAGYLHDNLHTRMLSGDPAPFGEVTEEMLEQAKRNLSDGLVFFGLTERFDESLVLAKKRLGFRSILYTTDEASARVNVARPRQSQLPKDLLRAAERCNQFDIELYHHAEALFDRIPERQELDFDVELAALRSGNAEGEVSVETPIPNSFSGNEDEWRSLVQARATVLRLEWQVARDRVRALTTKRPKGWQTEVKAARAKAQELEKEVSELKASAAKRQKRRHAAGGAKRKKGKADAIDGSRPKEKSKRTGAKAARSTPERDRRRAERRARREGQATS